MNDFNLDCLEDPPSPLSGSGGGIQQHSIPLSRDNPISGRALSDGCGWGGWGGGRVEEQPGSESPSSECYRRSRVHTWLTFIIRVSFRCVRLLSPTNHGVITRQSAGSEEGRGGPGGAAGGLTALQTPNNNLLISQKYLLYRHCCCC